MLIYTFIKEHIQSVSLGGSWSVLLSLMLVSQTKGVTNDCVFACVCPRSARQQQREMSRDKVITKKLAAHGGLTDSSGKRRRTLSGSAPAAEGGGSYGISQLFLPDNAPPGEEVSSTSELGTEDVKPNTNVRQSNLCQKNSETFRNCSTCLITCFQ